MTKGLALALILSTVTLTLAARQGPQPANEQLWDAARAGDTARITAALDRGADVNARAWYEVTALTRWPGTT